MEIPWRPSNKQLIAFNYLTDHETNEILYGGAAGGGKSHLGCSWIIYCCIAYPGTRYLIGRAILKTLKESTLLTFFKVCKEMGLRKGREFNYNSMSSVITFFNGSEVYLKDLFAYPSDPEFDELGSTEFTAAFIDEASQITQKAYNIVMSRIRYKLDEFGLIPKILIATNPTKNFIYMEFYKPATESRLQKYRKFVPALVVDNPYISKHYIDNLKKLDSNTRERLLFGNWEYDDDPSRLFEYDKILEMFNRYIKNEVGDKKYLTVDVARYGQDRTVIMLWFGFQVLKIMHFKEQSLKQTRIVIEKLMAEHSIPITRVVIDEDGLGGGLVDEIGAKGFVNNSKQILKSDNQFKQTNFSNLKSQCYFMLADYVNQGKIGISCEDIEVKRMLVEDLEQIKKKDPDKDGRLQITPKEDIKENLLRSPDFSDALMMRMLFVLKPEYIPYIA